MIRTFTIIPPVIPSAGLYHFTTDSGVKYEVRFGRKKNNLLCATIVFGVINDEYDGEEYIETNKGDVYKVMNTIVKVVLLFKDQHPNIRSYEFTGEPSRNENQTNKDPTKRIKMYHRYVNRIFGDSWKCNFKGNKITVFK
jgi:hypothetical protein